MDASWPAGYNTLGWVHLLRGNSVEALAWADRAIERAPNVENPHALRSLALVQQRRMLEATASMRRALRLSPRAPTWLLGVVAIVNLAAGRTDDAIDLMERVRSANRDMLWVRTVLAVYYEQEGRHDEAVAAVAEIKRIRPDLTAEEAMEIVSALEQVPGFGDQAQLLGDLRRAGLP
jgi:Flp pilus assembly protein TadD